MTNHTTKTSPLMAIAIVNESMINLDELILFADFQIVKMKSFKSNPSDID